MIPIVTSRTLLTRSKIASYSSKRRRFLWYGRQSLCHSTVQPTSTSQVQKARIKINPKKLYQADGYAVQEMLKVASILYSAIQQNQNGIVEEDDDGMTIAQMTGSINTKVRFFIWTLNPFAHSCFQLNELRVSRQLATEITDRGASLFDLLSKEVELKVCFLGVLRTQQIGESMHSIATMMNRISTGI